MFWIFQVFFILYGLYCLTFCLVVIYSSIVEEWFCPNRIPIWIEHIKRKNYQQINENSEINLEV